MPMIYICPYCTKEMPSGEEPELFECCGEKGHTEFYDEETGDSFNLNFEKINVEFPG